MRFTHHMAKASISADPLSLSLSLSLSLCVHCWFCLHSLRCALGECGDPSCPTYRPKRPEVRQAVEQTILESLGEIAVERRRRTLGGARCVCMCLCMLIIDNTQVQKPSNYEVSS